MSRHSLLFVISEPSSAMEEEFNEWYDREHIPERLGIDGFLSALRFVSTSRRRRYLALYDLTAIDVLQSPAYRAFARENYTPWTRRVISRAKFERREAVQHSPGNASTASAPDLLALRFSGLEATSVAALDAGARHCFADRGNIAQWRLFTGHGADEGTGMILVSGFGDLKALVEPDAFAPAAGRLDLAETFQPR